jgi:hypothetical protein
MFIHALPRRRILRAMTGSLQSGSDSYELLGLAGIPKQAGAPTLCRHCSSPAPEELIRVVGAWSVIDGVAQWDCDSCARARLEEIEAGADIHRTRA